MHERGEGARAAGGSRSRGRRVAVALAAGLWLAAPATGQDFEEVEIQTLPVAPGLHVLVGRGGNLAVSSGPDGVLLVDDQYAPLSEKIRAAVRAISPHPIRFVVNTHWHEDHTGGNEALGEAGAVIVAHDNVRSRMKAGQLIEGLERRVPPAPAGALPVLTFADGITFHWNGGTIEVVHVRAAHTDGDALVRFRDRDVIHMGDLYFNGFYPFIDVWSGGSIDGTIAGVDAVLAEVGPETTIIPGHGPLSNREELRRYRDMLDQVRARVRAALARGLDAEALVAEKPTADLDPEWGDGFLEPEQFLRIVHADLSRGATPPE